MSSPDMPYFFLYNLEDVRVLREICVRSSLV